MVKNVSNTKGGGRPPPYFGFQGFQRDHEVVGGTGGENGGSEDSRVNARVIAVNKVESSKEVIRFVWRGHNKESFVRDGEGKGHDELADGSSGGTHGCKA